VQGLDEVRIARLLGPSMDGPAAYLLGVMPIPYHADHDPEQVIESTSLTRTSNVERLVCS